MFYNCKCSQVKRLIESRRLLFACQMANWSKSNDKNGLLKNEMATSYNVNKIILKSKYHNYHIIVSPAMLTLSGTRGHLHGSGDRVANQSAI